MDLRDMLLLEKRIGPDRVRQDQKASERAGDHLLECSSFVAHTPQSTVRIAAIFSLFLPLTV